jgi:hypothetical protein
MPTIKATSRTPSLTFPESTQGGPMYGKTGFTQREADYLRNSPYGKAFKDMANAFGEVTANIAVQKKYYKDRELAEKQFDVWKRKQEEKFFTLRERATTWWEAEKARRSDRAQRQTAQDFRESQRQANAAQRQAVQQQAARGRAVGQGALIGGVLGVAGGQLLHGNATAAIGGLLGAAGGAIGGRVGGTPGAVIGAAIGEILGASLNAPSQAWKA